MYSLYSPQNSQSPQHPYPLFPRPLETEEKEKQEDKKSRHLVCLFMFPRTPLNNHPNTTVESHHDNITKRHRPPLHLPPEYNLDSRPLE